MLTRNDVHKIVDDIPEEKLPLVNDLLRKIYEECNEEVDQETIKAIQEAEKEIENNETVTLEDFIKENKLFDE